VIGLLQRVSEGRVTVDGEVVGEIGPGLVVLLCAEPGDDDATAARLLDKLLHYRVFADGEGRMNRSLADVGGGLLVVPQFTLAADTRKGLRPSFSSSASPDAARRLFEQFVALARTRHPAVRTGRFGARMSVALVNEGPVTFWLQVRPAAAGAPGEEGG
jgi:D-tyrosyl-tRNA(Tyr) deacylase